MNTPVRRWFHVFFLLPGMAFLASCSSVPILTDLATQTTTYKVTVVGAAIAAAVYYEDDIVFQVSNEPIEQGKFQITVNKSRFIGGRDGELWSIFKRSADYITRREECSSYTVLEYTESNESAIVAGNRVGRGTISCNKA